MNIESKFRRAVAITATRIRTDSPLIAQMKAVRDRYNGDYVVPLPNVAEHDRLPPTTPALIVEAIDSAARMASSVLFDVSCPQIPQSGRHVEDHRANAGLRRKILAGTYHQSGFKLLRRRGFRHLAGYATYGYMVIPDFRKEHPRIVSLDPLFSYPDPRAAGDEEPPEDMAVIHPRSAQWLRQTYPQVRSEYGGPIKDVPGSDEMWDTFEWVDPEVYLIGLLGPRDAEAQTFDKTRGEANMLLSWHPNLAGRPVAVMPRRVTLSKVASQIAQLTSIADLMELIQALDLAASEKSVYPDMYIVGSDSAPPMLVGGEWKDGRSGEINILHRASQVGALRLSPDQNPKMTIDRLERNIRVSSGLVPQMGGETYGALRTGRGIDSLLAAAVDPRIQEMHEIDEVHMGHLNEAIFAMWKGWWGGSKITLFSGWRSDPGIIEFDPEIDIPTTLNAVTYAIPGADVQQTTITLGQLLGVKGISLRSFRRLHPWIDDPEVEQQMIDESDMEEYAMQSIAAQIQSGQLPLTYLAKLERFRKQTHDIFAAIEKADEEVRREQAEMEARMQAEMEMGMDPAMDPMLQQGLGGPMPAASPSPMVEPQVADRVGQANQLMNALQAGAL